MDFSSLHDDSAFTDRRRDRLSELPDSLCLSILSLLDVEDAVRTTLLSKRWRDLWTTVPCLDFGEVRCDFVSGAIARWNGAKIHKFNISFNCEDDTLSSEFVDLLLLLAVEKQVEDLYILGTRTSCSSLTKLSVANFTLKVEGRVEWNRLKSLTIESFHAFREHDMNQMFLGAPLLEELVLRSTDFNERLDVRSSCLKKLEIGRYDITCFRSLVMAELRIWCPNLSSLEISACVYSTTCLLHVPSLTDVVLCLKETCDILGDVSDKDLPPLEMFYQLLHDMNENHMAVQFPNTKFLKLYAGEPEEMLDVLEMFPQLKTLIIELDEDLWYNMEYHKYALQSFVSDAIYPSPSLLQLKRVEIIWSQYNTSIFPAIEILLQNAHVLEYMLFQPKSYHDSCNRKLCETSKKKVLSMKRSSPTAEVVIQFEA